MKLLRSGTSANPIIAMETPMGKRLDVSAFGEDYDEKFFGSDGPDRLRAWMAEHEASCPELSPDAPLLSPIGRPSKIVCVGLNYAKHAAEAGAEMPTEPVLFFKASSAIVGPFDDIRLPRGSSKVDWEVELAIVIGARASYVSEAEALNHVAGYMVHNDISERAFQLERLGQWVKGKSCDTFAPLGPWLVTADEIRDPNNLRLWLKLNGKTVQDSNTSDFIFNVQQVISYISQFMTLLPGDVISTGTPSGVGLGMDPPRYLRAGDEVELGVEGLGISRQRIVE